MIRTHCRAFAARLTDFCYSSKGAVQVIPLLWPGFDRLTTDSPDGPRCAPHCEDRGNVHYLFSVRNMFFSGLAVLAPFRMLVVPFLGWPLLENTPNNNRDLVQLYIR